MAAIVTTLGQPGGSLAVPAEIEQSPVMIHRCIGMHGILVGLRLGPQQPARSGIDPYQGIFRMRCKDISPTVVEQKGGTICR